ncbi:protease pro-enzyme activation domain-containing protein [Streptacidiphilus sp. N1-3]|uniref:Protease pro-enzyme activation domain-containing protein n=1 Tax=Streptacidiphilus alkalitolerans TaxID=3342712 RepID=A0ABV6X818_9ACTN
MPSLWSGSTRTAAGAALSAIAAFSLVAGVAGTAQAVSTAGDNAAKLTPKRVGSAPRIPAGAVRTGSAAADTTLHLAVNLKPRDPAALSAFVAQVSDPKSANYHRYLATGQFASAFGPTKSTVDSVTKALRAAGLKPGALSKDGLSIPVTASVATASHALGTGFATVKLTDGTESYLNTSAPALPSGAAAEVSGITGLNNLSVMKSHHTKPVLAGKATGTGVGSRALSAHASGPNLCAGVTNLLKENGLVDTRDYYSPGALASAYGLPHTTTAGAGSTVAVFELEDVLESAISDWKSCLGISSAWSTVAVDGGHTVTADPTSNDVGTEAALDIEDVMALAPGASVIDYEGPDANLATEQNVLDVYQKMVDDNKAQVLSISWGVCDLDADPAQLAAENTIFAEAAAQGQTVVSSSGDAGSTDCSGDGSSNGANLSVDDPASQPYVTGVGGTWMNGSGSTLKQATWNYGSSKGGAGGGGVSNVWNSGNGPLLYQTGFTGSGYSNTCAAASGQVCRQVPDVSALADPSAGYVISIGDGYWNIIGGTSAAAPTWAAMIALAATTADCKANGRVGQLNPIVYNAARSSYGTSFTDITTGNNDWTPSGYKGGKYASTSGYDMATGLGTPKYAGLVGQLCGTKASSAGGSFFPITPVRVFDTRAAYHVGSYTTPIPANTTYTATVTGNAAGDNVPSTGVTAVALSVTAINPSTSSYVSVSGNGIGHGAATLTFVKGQIVPNAVVVPVKNGKVDFYNRFGTVDVAAVITGYYSSTGTGGSGFTPIPAAHMLDTRSGVGEPGGTAAKLGAGSTVTIKATDTPGIPAGVTALALNVTAINGTIGSYLGVYPSNAGQAAATSVSFSAKQILANTVIVPVDSDGNITISNHAGIVDATADVTGYYSAATGASFNALAPTHLVDTRGGTGGFKALGAGKTMAVPVTGIGGVPGNATAVVLNVTVVGPTATGFVSIYPHGPIPAATTGIDFSAKQTISNMVVVSVTAGQVDFYNRFGTTNVAADVLGYYAP